MNEAREKRDRRGRIVGARGGSLRIFWNLAIFEIILILDFFVRKIVFKRFFFSSSELSIKFLFIQGQDTSDFYLCLPLLTFSVANRGKNWKCPGFVTTKNCKRPGLVFISKKFIPRSLIKGSKKMFLCQIEISIYHHPFLFQNKTLWALLAFNFELFCVLSIISTSLASLT